MGQIQTEGTSGAFLKQRYESEKVKKGYFSQRRLLADIPKDTGLSGAAFQVDVKDAPMSTRAMNVPDALAIGIAILLVLLALRLGYEGDHGDD